MSDHAPLAYSRPSALQRWWVLAMLMLACVLPEVILMGADLGLWGSPRWRNLAYQYGAFWAGLLWDWQPNYALQPLTMFFSHAVLHAGLGHMIGNLAALWVLGTTVQRRMGQAGLFWLWSVSAIGGALAFGFLATTPAPMVGASGALSGMIGAWVLWNVPSASGEVRNTRFHGLWWVAKATAVLALGNVALWWLQDGQIAWQTHLGGYFTGLVFTMLVERRRILPKMRE